MAPLTRVSTRLREQVRGRAQAGADLRVRGQPVAACAAAQQRDLVRAERRHGRRCGPDLVDDRRGHARVGPVAAGVRDDEGGDRDQGERGRRRWGRRHHVGHGRRAGDRGGGTQVRGDLGDPPGRGVLQGVDGVECGLGVVEAHPSGEVDLADPRRPAGDRQLPGEVHPRRLEQPAVAHHPAQRCAGGVDGEEVPVDAGDGAGPVAHRGGGLVGRVDDVVVGLDGVELHAAAQVDPQHLRPLRAVDRRVGLRVRRDPPHDLRGRGLRGRQDNGPADGGRWHGGGGLCHSGRSEQRQDGDDRNERMTAAHTGSPDRVTRCTDRGSCAGRTSDAELNGGRNGPVTIVGLA